MAQYTATFPSPRQHNLVLTLTEGTKNLADQSVRVAYRLQVVKGVTWKTWTAPDPGNQPWSITLGGVVVASGSAFGFNFDTVTRAGIAPGTAFTIAEGSHVFDYDDDGTLSLSVAFSADADVWSGGSHGVGTEVMGVASFPSSGTVNLPISPLSVATQPEVVPKSANVADVVSVLLPRVKSTYTHDVTWQSGALSGTVATGVATQTNFTVPDVTDEFPAQAQSPITITAVTKDGATTIGTKSTTLLVWNEPPSLSTDTDPFDIRIRRVEWDGSRLRATNPIISLSLDLVDTNSSTPTLQVSTSGVVPGSDTDLEGALVVLDVQNGKSWQSTGLLFVLSRGSGDDVSQTDVVKWSGTGYLDFLLGRAYQVKDYKRSGSGTNAGNIMRALFSAAKSRQWGTNVNAGFPEHKTSYGDGWTVSGGTREISGGTPYSQILEAFVNDGWAEYRTRFDESDGICYLDMANALTGLDWTGADSQVAVNLSTAPLQSAPSTWSLEAVLDRVYAQGDAATNDPNTSDDNTAAPIASAESAPYDLNTFGRLEGWASAAGQTATSGVREVAQNALEMATETKSREFTYSARAVSRNLLPYYTFRPGDWILVPSDRDHSADPISMRVSQVTINKTGEDVTISVVCGDLIPTGATASLAKKIRAASGNRISGGTLRDPIPVQQLVPAAPNFAVEEAASSTGYWNSNGEPRAYITFSWEPVVSAIDGVTPITVDYYEVWWRPNVATEWALRTLSTTTSAEMADWPVYFTAQFRVRARSSAGAFGEFSAWDEVTTVEPAAGIDPPTVADIYTDGLGSIYITWAGLTGLDFAPLQLAYVVAEISSDGGVTYTTAGTPITGPGTIIVNPGAWGDFKVRIRAYDRLGNPGDASAPEDITLEDPYVIPQPIPATPTGLAATAGAGWDASGVSAEAWFDLTWDAVTLDVNGDPVNISGYDVWGAESGDLPRFLTSSATNSVRFHVNNFENWSFQVRAASVFGSLSDFSASVVATANASIAAPAAPAAPDLSQYAGILRVDWSGEGMTPAIRYAYATISASPSGPFTRAGMPLTGPGEIVIPGLATGETYYAKIVIVDELGQTGTSPVSAGILLEPITGVTIQTSPVANTGIKMTSGSLTAYDGSGNPTFILDATTGEVWIAPYDAVFALGAPGYEAESGDPTTGLSISSESSSFDTFIHASGVQIRNDQNPLSWWEADPTDASLVNFFSPRAVFGQRARMGDYEFLRESKTTGTRLVIRYRGA